jgi:trk system potassium uptake protein TrkH
MVVLSFAAAILLGTLALWLPLSHHGDVGLGEAFFTATSATCVTGLAVVDTGTAFTRFGQTVILVLIQLGGLGVMTFAALAFELLGRRLSLSGQEAMTRSLVHEEMTRGFLRHFRRLLHLVLGIEAIGASILFFAFLPREGVANGLYSAIFHSVSAFCNAGFSLYSDSLMSFGGHVTILSTISVLIILGGLGYPVLLDIISQVYKPKNRNAIPLWLRLSLHTRIVVRMSLLLVVGGGLFLFLLQASTLRLSVGEALFQSISTRTAGFNTIAIDALSIPALLIMVVLMFIGGSPGSCAGGVKTTTIALWVKQLWGRLLGQDHVVIQERTIPPPLVRRSSTIISLAILLNGLGVLFLSISEARHLPHALHALLFEQVSAFGTVGLSTGITPQLSQAGQLWIILTMFIGRTGPLTGVLLLLRRKPVNIRFPEAKVMIG